MRTEKEKMLAGELYHALDPQLRSERRRARLLLKALNDTRDDEVEERARLIKELIPSTGKGVWIEPPFYCDYGSNMTLGDNVFLNFNCVILDVVSVRIGSGVLLGQGWRSLEAWLRIELSDDVRVAMADALAVELGDGVDV